MVLYITSKCVSCLDIIPSGFLLTLCPLKKTEQLVGDQNLIQGSPPIDNFLSTIHLAHGLSVCKSQSSLMNFRLLVYGHCRGLSTNLLLQEETDKQTKNRQTDRQGEI